MNIVFLRRITMFEITFDRTIEVCRFVTRMMSRESYILYQVSLTLTLALVGIRSDYDCRL